MQMIEAYAYQVGPRVATSPIVSGQVAKNIDFLKAWADAVADYNASPVRGKAFCTLNRQEQVEIVRKYVNR
jgi:hypothetical protein